MIENRDSMNGKYCISIAKRRALGKPSIRPPLSRIFPVVCKSKRTESDAFTFANYDAGRLFKTMKDTLHEIVERFSAFRDECVRVTQTCSPRIYQRKAKEGQASRSDTVATGLHSLTAKCRALHLTVQSRPPCSEFNFPE